MSNNQKIDFSDLTIEDIKIGMWASYSHTITDADVRSFARLSGDNNPIHMSDEYAKNSRFGARIAHGLYSASFFSALFGTELPGTGCVYVSQNLRFKLPIYIGNTVEAKITVTSVDIAKRHIHFSTKCLVKRRAAIEGEAIIYIPQNSRKLEK